MFECACIHIRTHVRMHASLLSGKASFPLTVDGQTPATLLLNFDVAPRAPNLILAGRGAMRRSADWPKSCTPRAQPTNIESGVGGARGSLRRRPACAGGAGFCPSTDSGAVLYMRGRCGGDRPTRASQSSVRCPCLRHCRVHGMRLRRYGACARACGGGGGGGSSVASDVRSGFRALAPALRRLTESHH